MAKEILSEQDFQVFIPDIHKIPNFSQQFRDFQENKSPTTNSDFISNCLLISEVELKKVPH